MSTCMLLSSYNFLAKLPPEHQWLLSHPTVNRARKLRRLALWGVNGQAGLPQFLGLPRALAFPWGIAASSTCHCCCHCHHCQSDPRPFCQLSSSSDCPEANQANCSASCMLCLGAEPLSAGTDAGSQTLTRAVPPGRLLCFLYAQK